MTMGTVVDAASVPVLFEDAVPEAKSSTVFVSTLLVGSEWPVAALNLPLAMVDTIVLDVCAVAATSLRVFAPSALGKEVMRSIWSSALVVLVLSEIPSSFPIV